MNFKNHLPVECPPEDAHSPNSIVYRVSDHNPPIVKDFLSYRELYPDEKYEDECLACGLSVFTEIEGIKRMYRRVPAKKKKNIRKKVFKGFLKPEHGKIKNTPSNNHKSHHTWWHPIEVNPQEIFEFMISVKELIL